MQIAKKERKKAKEKKRKKQSDEELSFSDAIRDETVPHARIEQRGYSEPHALKVESGLLKSYLSW
jgi:hypothetical protein